MTKVEQFMDFELDDIDLDFDLDDVILYDPVKELLEQIQKTTIEMVAKLNEIQVRIDSIENKISNN